MRENQLQRVEIAGFIWLDEVVEKIARKHHVEVHEAEEVFVEAPKFRFVEKGHHVGEHVYSASGRTDAGGYLIVSSFTKRTAALYL